MKFQKVVLTPIAMVFGLFACAQINQVHPVEAHPLYKFAQANCMFQFFEKKGYDSEGLRAISGGIVETSEYSPERYQEIALFLASYEPTLTTKASIEPDLNRCFHLDQSQELKNLIMKRE